MNDDRQAVLAANDSFYRAFEKKSIEAMEKTWSQGTACLCIHPGRPSLKGWSAIRNSWIQIFKNTDYIEIDTELLATEVSGDLASIVLVENILQVSQNQRLKAQSMATNLFERLGERWYMIHHHGSPVIK